MCGDPPVGGRISLFCRHVASSHIRCRCSFCGAIWFPIFGSKPFFGCHTEVTVTPQDPKVILRIQEEIRDLISKVAIVQIDDVPNLCLSPIFVIP